MKREIKFRAWANNKMWHYVELTSCKDGSLGISVGDNYSSLQIPQKVELMQRTGIKDNQGKDIFEDDIVKIYGYKNDVTEQGEVFWCTYSLRWKVETYGFTKDNNIEIIGNIHQDKHLLK